MNERDGRAMYLRDLTVSREKLSDPFDTMIFENIRKQLGEHPVFCLLWDVDGERKLVARDICCLPVTKRRFV